MTKVTILGQEQPKEGKKIEFVSCYGGSKEERIIEAHTQPHNYKYIELIQLATSNRYYDVMFAHDGDRKLGVLYFGYFNSGTV